MTPPLTGRDGDGNTPLDPDEAEGLIPAWIATRADLDRAEAANVHAGREWARRQHARRDVLDVGFMRELHRRMFGDVWRWAGSFRTSAKSIGVPPHRISTELQQLIDDVRYWNANDTYPVDERAARYHHRLVAIHPFVNGNGRSTRELADLYLLSAGRAPFTWGISLGEAARPLYLTAVRAADRQDYEPLLAFVRSP